MRYVIKKKGQKAKNIYTTKNGGIVKTTSCFLKEQTWCLKHSLSRKVECPQGIVSEIGSIIEFMTDAEGIIEVSNSEWANRGSLGNGRDVACSRIDQLEAAIISSSWADAIIRIGAAIPSISIHKPYRMLLSIVLGRESNWCCIPGE